MKSIRSVNRTKLLWCKGHKGDLPEFLNMMSLDDVYYRESQPGQKGQPSLQFALLAKFRKHALRGCHDGVGHLGLELSVDF